MKESAKGNTKMSAKGSTKGSAKGSTQGSVKGNKQNSSLTSAPYKWRPHITVPLVSQKLEA